MTELTSTPGRMSPGPRPHKPTFTYGESKKGDLINNRAEYDTYTRFASQIWYHHEQIGTPVPNREPTAMHIELIVGQTVDATQEDLLTQLESRVDSHLDMSEAALDQATAAIDRAYKYPAPITTPESGITLSGQDAADTATLESQTIEENLANGMTQDLRVHPFVKSAGKVSPWLEGIGVLAWSVFYMDVPLLAPWEDWLSFTLALTIVVVVTWGQSRLVHEAAKCHNQAREARANGNRHEAEAGFTTRNWYLLGAGVVAASITAALILRGTASVGVGSGSTLIVLISLAVVTGILMPTLAYFADALDGSKISRERDSLAGDLEADHSEQDSLKEEGQAQLDLAAGAATTVLAAEIPNICTELQASLDEVHGIYNFVRTQIGPLAAAPPKPVRRAVQEVDGAFIGELSTGIPGARAVDLLPVFDRLKRLQGLEARRGALQSRLDAIPPHPWAHQSSEN